ncbi:MAG: DUF2283 domain-containing protein [Dehalococcoidia bacterium]
MKIIYDEAVDILYIRLREGEYEESDEVSEGLIVDYDKEGRPIAIEILSAASLLGSPERLAVEFSRERKD